MGEYVLGMKPSALFSSRVVSLHVPRSGRAADTMHRRPFNPDDAPFLWEALYHAVFVPPGEEAPAYEIVKHPELKYCVAGWMRHPGDFGFVVEENGVRIGAAWLRRWSGRERGFGFVGEETPELSMALLPEYRGRGIGTRLLRHLLSAAEEFCDAVSLSVSEMNPARRLYEREGFMAFSAPEGDSITMIKRFASGNTAQQLWGINSERDYAR